MRATWGASACYGTWGATSWRLQDGWQGWCRGGGPFPEEWGEENSGLWWENPYPDYFVEVGPEEAKVTRLIRRELRRQERGHALEIQRLEREGKARVVSVKARYERERAAAEAASEEKRRRRGVGPGG